MIQNPHTLAAEDARKESSEREAFRYPIHVCAVYHFETAEERNLIEIVKKWCMENKVTFKARMYNSTKYDEDCQEVARIPAYHIYWKGYHRTVHWDERPVQAIQETILRHKAELENKRQRQEKLEALKAQLRGWFRLSRFKKKSRLEITLTPKAAPAKAAVPVEFENKTHVTSSTLPS